MTNDLLFVYGTLLLADNEFANYLNSNSTFCCKAKIKGRLYDVGHYPAFVIDQESGYYVVGMVYRLHAATDTLRELDAYEGYGEGEEQPYLYIREALTVDTDLGIMNCWVYLYNRPVDGMREITTGDYNKYLKHR